MMKLRSSLYTSALCAFVALLCNGSEAYKMTGLGMINDMFKHAVGDPEASGELRDSYRGDIVKCRKGVAKVCLDTECESFDCDNVDLYSFVSMKEQDIPISERNLPDDSDELPPAFYKERTPLQNYPSTSFMNDIWGWISPNGKEITIQGTDSGVVLIDSTNPSFPCVVAKIPMNGFTTLWKDMKVYKDTLYITSEDGFGFPGAPDDGIGIEVVDLLKINLDNCPDKPAILEIDYNFRDFVNGIDRYKFHNMALNPQTGYMYLAGGNYPKSNICNGGVVMVSLKNRLKPKYVGCLDSEGYTHDLQCLVYPGFGPDKAYTNKEICFTFNEQWIAIWDVTNKKKPELISRTSYFNQVYVHQGWVSGDMKTLLVNDEGDEQCTDYKRTAPFNSTKAPSPTNVPPNICDNALEFTQATGFKKTHTLIFDITSLKYPKNTGFYEHKDESIDHNLFFWGQVHRDGLGGTERPLTRPPTDPTRYAYLTNHDAGLRILDSGTGKFNRWKEVGFFDTTTVGPNNRQQIGTWGSYMHPSGVLAVSDIFRGTFFLQPRQSLERQPCYNIRCRKDQAASAKCPSKANRPCRCICK